MSRATHLAFLSLAVFLVLFTGTVGKPGLPTTLKADEPAYLLMALSLVEDGDLRVEPRDLPRLEDSYPFLPTENLILMTDDGWNTVYYGKPYIYSLLAAPLVAVFGVNGLVSFNALLFVLMIWCATHYLKDFNDEGPALFYACAFFGLSPVWAYVFWIQPEVLNMASVMLAFYFVFGTFGSGRLERWSLPLSAGALAVGTYNKPVLLAFALPLVYAIYRRREVKAAGIWIAALALALLVLAGGSMLLTGHPTAYLGVARGGIKVENPGAAVERIELLPKRLEAASTTANSWSWVFRAPPTTLREIRQNLGYFFWGRHTGLLPYMPFAVISLVLFLVHRRRRPEGWLTLLALATIALFFICVIPRNWHGGGGFIGNRYFVMAYPAFLFLVTSVKPTWLVVPGAAGAGLFLGSILFTPFGAPVPLPTLQAHTRNPPFQMLPFELSLRKTLPGYGVFGYSHLTLTARKDYFMPDRDRGGVPLIHARVPVEIMAMTDRPITGLFFELTTFPPSNLVEIDFAGDREVLRFENADRAEQRSKVFEVQPERSPQVHWESGARTYIYPMRIHTSEGERRFEPRMPSPVFFAGAKLNFLGRRDQLVRAEHYKVLWLKAEAPTEVEAGSTISVPIRLRNTSSSPFSSKGPIPVNLAYRWIRPDGTRLHATRFKFEEPVVPGSERAAQLEIEVPQTAGDYHLELDLVREHVAWFSDIASEAKSLTVHVQ